MDNGWHTSSYSVNGSQCVEVCETTEGALVRDSVNPELGHLAFPADQWTALLGRLSTER